MPPEISVVMPVFNGEAFLAEAIESILAQTFTDFEFIIIDDGSSDRTGEILADYAKQDSRVRVFSQENTGVADTLNRGLHLASAPLVARMDADDVSLPHRLKEQVDFLHTHPHVGLLSGAYERMDPSGRALGVIRPPLEDSEIRTVMLQHSPMCHPAVIMRRDVALTSGGYRKALLDAEDYDLWVKMAERTQLANLDLVVLKYRVHARQISIQNMKHQAWCGLAVRAAASARKCGNSDPLSDVQEITPRVLQDLGITAEEIRRAVVDLHTSWIGTLHESDPELALRINDNLRGFSRPDSMKRPVVADLRLRVAAIHFKQGKLLRAVSSAARGVLTRPIVAGRPVKRACARLAASLRS